MSQGARRCVGLQGYRDELDKIPPLRTCCLSDFTPSLQVSGARGPWVGKVMLNPWLRETTLLPLYCPCCQAHGSTLRTTALQDLEERLESVWPGPLILQTQRHLNGRIWWGRRHPDLSLGKRAL